MDNVMGATEDYAHFIELAERMNLEDKEAEGFVNESMKRLGHKMKAVWEDATPEGNDGNVSFFGGGKKTASGGGRSGFQYPNG